LIRSSISSTGTPARIAQKSTSVWRCRALSDISAQTPLTSRLSFGPSPAPTADPTGPAITLPRRAPAAAATASWFSSRRSSLSRSATPQGYRRERASRVGTGGGQGSARRSPSPQASRYASPARRPRARRARRRTRSSACPGSRTGPLPVGHGMSIQTTSSGYALPGSDFRHPAQARNREKMIMGRAHAAGVRATRPRWTSAWCWRRCG
jgi:hypothetical protein